MANKPYREPTDFIPEAIRKKHKLGEYNDDLLYPEEKEDKKTNKKIRDFVDENTGKAKK